ncbi:MAG: hypothetical protein WC593_01425 [Methanoregula sp.]
MPSFSERYDFKPKQLVQTLSLADESRNLLWNVFFKNYQESPNNTNKYCKATDRIAKIQEARKFGYELHNLFNAIWCDFLKKIVDERPYGSTDFFIAVKKEYFETTFSYGNDVFNWNWWKVYDFLEFVSMNDKNIERKKVFQDDCNKIMEKEGLEYRFIENLISPIISEEQITEIKTAISNSTEEVQVHLRQSLIILSNRENPDFRNSIKESISAVEAQCRIICDEPTPTLTKSLEIIQRSGRVKVHPDLNGAFQKIYSWTNDDEGIRHALKNMPTVDQEDAQFMLIASSAFINYLQVKKRKSEI